MTNLPNTYQEVEYIQSSGTQYINTGYTPLTTTEFDITYEWVSFLSRYQTPIGTRKDFDTQAYYFGWDSYYSHSFYGFGTNHVDPSTVAFGGLGQVFNITYKNGVISNGTQSANVAVSGSPYGNLCIFAEEHNGNIQEFCAMKLYGLKLWEGGTLIRNFVPCYRKSDNIIGLYDTVNSQFYTNAGTGTFTKGADVIPPKKYIDRYYLNGEVYGIKFATPVIDNYIPDMTADTQDGFTATSSTLLNAIEFHPRNAFHASLNANDRAWHSNNVGSGGRGWSQIQMPNSIIATKIQIRARGFAAPGDLRPINAFNLNGSNDGLSRTTILSVSGLGSTWSIGSTQYWDITGETTAYEYLRLEVQATGDYVAFDHRNVSGIVQ